MRFGLLVLFVFSSLGLSSPTLAAGAHISDKVTVFMHRGPSNQYRIKANVPSGTMLDVLEQNKATGYSRVRLVSGTEGWVQSKYIDNGDSITVRLPAMEKALARSSQIIEEQKETISALETDLNSSNEKQARSTADTAQLQNEVDRLQRELEAMDETNLMGWFLRGGALALGGILIGLIVPHLPKRRRRKDDWF